MEFSFDEINPEALRIALGERLFKQYMESRGERMSECVYTRAECHHQGTKCSECPLTDLICDEFTDCLDLSYQQGRADAIEERASLLAYICKKYNIPLVDMNQTVDEWEERKQKNEQ